MLTDSLHNNDRIFLIDSNLLNDYLINYHDECELEHINNKINNEPKADWLFESGSINYFIVPTIKINDTSDICIIDGRHRTCWMISKNMTEIPVTCSQETKESLESKNIILKPVSSLDLPFDVVPKKGIPPFIDTTAQSKNLLDILKQKN
jgi:hypothetical protein